MFPITFYRFNNPLLQCADLTYLLRLTLFPVTIKRIFKISKSLGAPCIKKNQTNQWAGYVCLNKTFITFPKGEVQGQKAPVPW